MQLQHTTSGARAARLLPLGLTLGLTLGVLGACDSDDVQPPHGVLLLSIDSLRRDHVGAYGYTPRQAPSQRTTPTLDALAAEGVLFEDGYSTTSWTLPSHAALMTGLPDALHGVVNNAAVIAPELVTLAELFQADGYRTAGFFSGPNVHPAFGFGAGFDAYVDCSNVDPPEEFFGGGGDGSLAEVHHASHRGVTSPALLDAASAFIDERVDDGAPFFCFVHWWDVHYDYSAPDEYKQRFAVQGYRGSVQGIYSEERSRRFDAADVQHLLALYDAEIRYTDDHIGRLIARIDAAPWRDDVLIVATSDHGEEFFEHGRWGHQHTLFEEVVRIPLIARWPAGLPSGARIVGPARLYDVYPSLVGALGVDLPDYVDGQDLFGPARAKAELSAPAPLHLDVPQIKADQSGLVLGDYKVVSDRRRGTVGAYELNSDPNEQRPIAQAARSEELNALGQQLGLEVARWAQLRPTIPGADGTLSAEVDPELRELLEAAGYVTEAPPETEPDETAPSESGQDQAPAQDEEDGE